MSTEIEKAKSFEEKMKDRIRESIGDLLSDEDLKKMIDQGVEDLFLKKKKIKASRSYDPDIEGPSLLEEIIKETLESKVKGIAIEYLKNHGQEVQQLVTSILNRGLAENFLSAFQSVFLSPFSNFRDQVNYSLTQITGKSHY